MRDYWYIRSGFLHHKYMADDAIRLSKAEEERVLQEMRENPADKQGVFEKHWGLYTKIMDRKPFAWQEYFDRHCEEKRRAGGRR